MPWGNLASRLPAGAWSVFDGGCTVLIFLLAPGDAGPARGWSWGVAPETAHKP